MGEKNEATHFEILNPCIPLFQFLASLQTTDKASLIEFQNVETIQITHIFESHTFGV